MLFTLDYVRLITVNEPSILVKGSLKQSWDRLYRTCPVCNLMHKQAQ